MKTNRIFAVIICVVMLLTLIPVSAFALNVTDKVSEVELKLREPRAGETVNLSFSSVEAKHHMTYKVVGLRWYKEGDGRQMGVESGADTYFIGSQSYTVEVDLEVKNGNGGWNITYEAFETDYSGIHATINGNTAVVKYPPLNSDQQKTVTVAYTFSNIADGIVNYPSIAIPTPIAGNLPPEKEDLTVGDPRATWLPSTDYLWYVYENNAWRKMTQDEHYVAGARYKVELAIQTLDGFRFNVEDAADYRNDGGKQIWGYVNGDKRTMALRALGTGQDGVMQYDDEIVYVTYEFTSCEAQYVDSVSFSGLTAPSATQHPQYNAPSMTGSYTMLDDEEFTGGAQFNFVNGIQWTSVYGLMDENSVFEMGGVYSMTFFIKTFDTHRFTDWVEGSADVGYVDVMVLPDDPTIAMVTVTFAPCDGGVLSEVNISGIKNPVHGEAPDYEFTYGQGYDLGTSADAIVWYDLTADKKLLSTDTFIYGHEYELRIILRSEKQILGASTGKFEFAPHDSLTVKANGISATKIERYNGNSEANWLEASIPFDCDKHIIEQVVITVENPVEGMNPAKQIGKGNDAYNIADFAFVDSDTYNPVKADDVFAGSKTYIFALVLTPAEGYTFKEGVTAATVNGATAFVVSADESTALITYTFIADEAPYCLITFSAGEGSGSMSDMIIKGSMFFTLPECEFEAPDGKHFIGWSADYGETILQSINYYLDGVSTLSLTAVYESDDENAHVHIYSPDFNAHDDLSHYKTCVSPTCPEFGSDMTKSTAPGDEMMHQYDNDCDDTCNDCGYERSLNNAGDPLHFYEYACSEVCPNCGLTREGAPHTPGAEATCTEDQICTVCSGVLVEATGNHTPGAEATCTEPQICTVCSGVLAEATGNHTPGAAATCTEPQICTVCSGVLAEATGNHTPGAAATCTEPQICTVCSGVLAEATGNHTLGAEATCTDAQICTVCGIEIAPALGHAYGVEWITNENGHHKLCSCGEIGENGTHKDSDGDKACDICGFDMREGMAGWAIALIVIGSVLVVGVGGFAIFWFVIKKKTFADLVAMFKKN